MAYLILVRGLPGSGKSTLAKSLTEYHHVEADMFFMQNGEYRYDPTKIKDAHEWCQHETFKALNNGKNVVVSNTFSRLFELEPYFVMAKTFGIQPLVIETKGDWPNTHNVSSRVIEKMRHRWEHFRI